MNSADLKKYLSVLSNHVLRRDPTAAEINAAELIIAREGTESGVLAAILAMPSFKYARAIECKWPTGHFYSPVVNPGTVKGYLEREYARNMEEILAGINIDSEAMEALWHSKVTQMNSYMLPKTPSQTSRYGWEGSPYPFSDATSLRMMIQHKRPKQIVEIGSGNSTVCMLDALDDAGMWDTKLTCIEPYPDRLKRLLRDGDESRIRLLTLPIQSVGPDIVDDLSAGDILFIDSTHVMKTGSDVHYEIFYLLPRLKKGVMVHFHDIRYPFEYNRRFVLEFNYSWNEAYALRAFLMHNSQFKITFWNTYLAKTMKEEIETTFAAFMENPGSSIWLERC